MTAVLGTAPATAASEVPDPAHTAATTVGSSEAILIACALVEHAARLTAPPAAEVGTVSRIVRVSMAGYSHAELLSWPDRVPSAEHSTRWRAARDLTARLYPDLPGAATLPDLYAPPDTVL